jgi:hypothetical protein
VITTNAALPNLPVDLARTPPQELPDKADWLNRRLDEAIARVSQIKHANHGRSGLIKIATVTFSSAITVLLGLDMAGIGSFFNPLALILGGLVTLLNALDPFFNFRALWIEHEAALARFQRIKDQLGFLLAGTEANAAHANELERIYQDYQQVWLDLGQTWVQARRSSDQMG